MKQGTLAYDYESDRLDVEFLDGTSFGGLNCGQVIEVLCPCCNEWRAARVEMNSEGWYLAELGLLGKTPDMYLGISVRLGV